MENQSKEQIRDAVIIAALSALFTGIINWGLEVGKAKQKEISEALKKVKEAEDKKKENG